MSQPARRTYILFRCHAWICAFPSVAAQRLVAVDEAVSVSQQVDLRPMVTVGSEAYVAWNLGALLGAPDVEGGWLLLQAHAPSQRPPLALRVGQHLTVLDLESSLPLPSSTFQTRREAFTGAFQLPVGLTHGQPPFGVLLEPRALWTAVELQAARLAWDTHQTAHR